MYDQYKDMYVILWMVVAYKDKEKEKDKEKYKDKEKDEEKEKDRDLVWSYKFGVWCLEF